MLIAEASQIRSDRNHRLRIVELVDAGVGLVHEQARRVDHNGAIGLQFDPATLARLGTSALLARYLRRRTRFLGSFSLFAVPYDLLKTTGLDK